MQKSFFLNSFFVGIEGSGSISQRQGSADPDPDPHQNVMDPEHCTWVYSDHYPWKQDERPVS